MDIRRLILELTKKIPRSIASASIQETQAWLGELEWAKKLVKLKSTTPDQLQRIYASLQKYE